MACHVAVYSLFPVLHCGIVTVCVALDNSVPVHQAKLYPSLVGFINVKVHELTSYFIGLVHATLHPFKL
jgi:hypothetical protein